MRKWNYKRFALLLVVALAIAANVQMYFMKTTWSAQKAPVSTRMQPT